MWAPQNYGLDQMALAIEGQRIGTRTFTLRVEAIPAGVAGAPAVGTSWEIPKDNSFSLTLPTYRTDDGLEGYRFTVTMTAASNGGASTNGGGYDTTGPCAPAGAVVVLALAGGVWLLSTPRFRRPARQS